ncbi:MAG: hypothetical protein WEA34_02740 [Gemmatimonadota bacterium]
MTSVSADPDIQRDTDQYDAAATPEYGTDTLREFYVGVLRRGLEGHELGEQGLF